ncbi:MazG nucleotide pyrophosphohydrolase domain-containing protein [Streptococcus tangpeifui]|uniref:MazG nucleotide pyrophosphohydrolase domain-containing protein n=1 Tax=Streptococcus tangpeifui TaxID=2709400 RepID=UPI0013EE1E6C|nr:MULTISPECIES: MazG-like family protein [unclassified Streptococcus]
MDLKDYQKWVSTFYKKRHWYQYNVFIRCNFLTEEVGELAQAVRKREIGRDRPDELVQGDAENLADIKEELGDVLDNIFILADKYQISLEDIMETHKNKLEKRFAP